MKVSQKKDVARLSYKISGIGCPLIFIHGWAADSMIWNDVTKKLSDNFMTITVDLRGCGLSGWKSCADFIYSSAEDVNSLIGKLGLKDAVIIGWSLGGMVAMRVASLFVENIKKLILVSTTPKFVKDETFVFGAERGAFLYMKKTLLNNPAKTLEDFKDTLLRDSEKNPVNLKKFNRLFSKVRPQSMDVLLGSFESLEKLDLRDEIKNINLPTLIIHGKDDNICLYKAAEFMKENIKNSLLKGFDGAGHMPVITKEEDFIFEVKKFLK